MLSTDPDRPGLDANAVLIERYLVKTLHVEVALAPWGGGRTLPVFLSALYDYYEADIAGALCLFITIREGRDTPTPAEAAKHVDIVSAQFSGPVIFVPEKLDATMRARLIEAGIPFAVPGNQLYIPQLAMDLREHFRAPRSARPDKLSPSAQLVMFYMLLSDDVVDAATPSYLAERLEYSPMTMGRAVDELVALGLATSERSGREKRLRFKAEGRLLIDMAKTLMKSPVSKRFHVRWMTSAPRLPLSGLSALAAMTDLNDNGLPCFAVSFDDWKKMLSGDVLGEVQDPYEADAIIETWKYDPTLISNPKYVDPLSLYAQFWDSEDERIAMSAQQLLGQWSW